MQRNDHRRSLLFISSSSGPGGAETVFLQLATAAHRRGIRVLAVLFRPGWLKDALERTGVEVNICPMKGMFDWRWVKHIVCLVRSRHVELIHAHEFTANVYGVLAGRLAGIPVVATVHGKNYYWECLRRRMAYRLVARFGRMVAVSKDLKEFLIRHVNIPDDRIFVIYNGIVAKTAEAATGEVVALSTLGLDKHTRVICSVGSLYPVKGHEYLIRALPKIVRIYPNLVLVLIGRGEQETVLRQLSKALGVQEHIRFLGFRSDVATILTGIEIFVLPSLSEGLSIALLEAMAAGKPIVASRVGGNPEVVVDGKTGFLVDSRDPKALAERIVELLNDSKKSKELGESGRERVQNCFTIDKMVDSYGALYESMGLQARGFTG